jgi:hypothetical protein
MDGNFQLKRLKCAGNNIGEPLIKDQFIMKQEQYDEWINLYGKQSINGQVSKS